MHYLAIDCFPSSSYENKYSNQTKIPKLKKKKLFPANDIVLNQCSPPSSKN